MQTPTVRPVGVLNHEHASTLLAEISLPHQNWHTFALFNGIAACRQVRKSVAIALAFLAVVVIPGRTSWAQTQAEAKNMNLVGSNDLQGRSAYQPTIELSLIHI